MERMELKESDIKKLSELARVSLEEGEEDLISNLREILEYFSVLEEVDTKNVEPLSGGTEKANVLRGDAESWPYTGSGAGDFANNDNGFMKIPSVFGDND